ncbi:porin family protein [Sphingomonas sp. CL5.1]|uniref:outer membrane protein n=1 Tax=Sphingomonas sp. CL5.1 TaxID=2653203 RepID=UPI001582EA91|nr:outer membrane beta-barrel protein [Sphingomonas sp. CL5.1]QKR98824.1 porin family protein [Sphingomonas sp. CL5.1]
MRKLVIATAAAAMGAALATPALAQSQAPFSGPRVEVLAGWDHLNSHDGDSDGRDGFTYGGAVGYDARIGGNAVLGVEGEIDGATTKARAYDVVNANDSFRLKAGRDIYVGGRLGYVVSPQAMIYAKAGYTNARFNARYFDGTSTVYEDGRNLDGYRLGAGVEYNLTPTAYIKGEYRYSHYGHMNGIDNYDPNVDRHQIMAGVGMRF